MSERASVWGRRSAEALDERLGGLIQRTLMRAACKFQLKGGPQSHAGDRLPEHEWAHTNHTCIQSIVLQLRNARVLVLWRQRPAARQGPGHSQRRPVANNGITY